jgi:hypothetical protein
MATQTHIHTSNVGRQTLAAVQCALQGAGLEPRPQEQPNPITTSPSRAPGAAPQRASPEPASPVLALFQPPTAAGRPDPRQTRAMPAVHARGWGRWRGLGR